MNTSTAIVLSAALLGAAALAYVMLSKPAAPVYQPTPAAQNIGGNATNVLSGAVGIVKGVTSLYNTGKELFGSIF